MFLSNNFILLSSSEEFGVLRREMPFQVVYRTVGFLSSRFQQKYFIIWPLGVCGFFVLQEEFSNEIPLQRVWIKLPVLLEQLDALVVPRSS